MFEGRVSGRLDGIAKILAVDRALFGTGDSADGSNIGVSLRGLRLRGYRVEGSNRIINVATRAAVSNALRRQENDSDLLFLDRRLGSLLDVRPLCECQRARLCNGDRGTDDLRYIGELFVGGNSDRLNKELVSTFCVQGGIFSHSLQQD